MATDKPVFHFVLKTGVNGSMYLFLRDNPPGSSHDLFATEKPYDDNGALAYIISVIIIYGLSILLMIASVVKKEKGDDRGMSKYMNDLEKIRRAERKFHKQKTKFVLKKIWRFGRSASAPHSIGLTKSLGSKYPGKISLMDTPPESRSSFGSEEQTRFLHKSTTASSLDSLGSDSQSGSPDADSVFYQHRWPNNALLTGADDQYENRTSPIYFAIPDRDQEVSDKKMPEDRKPSAVTLHTVFEEEDEEDY